MANTKHSIYIALIVVSFLWGTSFAVAPLNLVILRFVIPSVTFGLLLCLQPRICRIAYQDIPRYPVGRDFCYCWRIPG